MDIDISRVDRQQVAAAVLGNQHEEGVAGLDVDGAAGGYAIAARRLKLGVARAT